MHLQNVDCCPPISQSSTYWKIVFSRWMKKGAASTLRSKSVTLESAVRMVEIEEQQNVIQRSASAKQISNLAISVFSCFIKKFIKLY